MTKRLWKYLALGVVLTAGCSRVLVIEAEMPPLVPLPKTVRSIGVGEFAAVGETPPHLAAIVGPMLAVEIREGGRYRLAREPAGAGLTIRGEVLCRIVDAAVQRPADLAGTVTGTTTVRTRSAEVAVSFVHELTKAIIVEETPPVEEKRKFEKGLPDIDKLGPVLLRACVRAFVADISPRVVRVKVPRPGIFGHGRTRRGIDLITSNPAQAIVELTAAVEHDPKDAAALNALGLLSEKAGDLDLAASSYTLAAAINPRREYRENVQRVHDLLGHRKRILKVDSEPEGKPN